MKLFYSLRVLFFCSFFLFLAGVSEEEDLQFTFPDFSTEDNTLVTFGDAAHSPANRSYIIYTGATHSRGSCGALVCKKKVRIQDIATGRVASFRFSFSFIFTTHGVAGENANDGIGLSLSFLKTSNFAELPKYVSQYVSGAFNTYQSSPDFELQPAGFVFITVAGDSPSQNSPSNNTIRIYKNLEDEDMSAYKHDLCGNDTHCSYFPNGRIFTGWIDFNSSAHVLEVRLANGLHSSVKKPVQPLMHIANYRFAKEHGDDVYPAFWGSSAPNHLETYELLSWSFFSSAIPDLNTPPFQSLLHFLKARRWTGIAIGVLATVAAWVIIRSISRLATKSRYHCRYTPLDYTTGPHKFSYAELRKATENFDERNLLGSGASGSVYRGSLEGKIATGGKLVAVKQIRVSESKQAEALFHAEMASLGQIRHRNVLQLQGWCQEKGRLLLVFDYMPNGALHEWLHASEGHFHRQALSLQMRQSILEGVGVALEYLHEDCPSVVLHRDIKSSNVLLDSDFKALLGDFGLARLMDHHMLDKTTLPAGTFGCMAPKMPYTGKATKESDVYSFGILLLEILCGRHPFELFTKEPEDLMLLHYVWRAHEAGALLSVVDPRLFQTLQPLGLVPIQDHESTSTINLPISPTSFINLIENIHVTTIVNIDNIDIEVSKLKVVHLLHLGLLCCLPNPKDRPSIVQMNGILQQIRDMESLSNKSITVSIPSLPTTRSLGLYNSLESLQTILSSNSSAPSSISLSYNRSIANNSTLQQVLNSLHKDD